MNNNVVTEHWIAVCNLSYCGFVRHQVDTLREQGRSVPSASCRHCTLY
jgi:hypothetical protein